jgi:signal peptidase
LQRACPALALLGGLQLALVIGLACRQGGLMLLAVLPVALTGPMAARLLASSPPKAWLTALSDLGMLAVVVAFFAFALGPRFAGYETMTVLSTSMKPHFGPGDVIVVRREPARDVRVGQVISFHIPIGDHHVVSHRIVNVVSRGAHPVVQTKGDANSTADPWKARLDGNSVWRQRLTVRSIGWPLLWLREPSVRLLTLYGAPALLALLLLGRIWVPERLRLAEAKVHGAFH